MLSDMKNSSLDEIPPFLDDITVNDPIYQSRKQALLLSGAVVQHLAQMAEIY